MPAALSAGGCWFPWQLGAEGAGRAAWRGGEALAQVARHPADTPNAGIFQEAAGFQLSSPLATALLPNAHDSPTRHARGYLYKRG